MNCFFVFIVCIFSLLNLAISSADNQNKKSLQKWKKSFVLDNTFQGPMSISYNCSDTQIITTVPGYVSIWDSKNGTKIASLNQEDVDQLPGYDKPSMVKLDEQADRLFIINRNGRSTCRKLQSFAILWDSPARNDIFGRATFNLDQTQFILQDWQKAILINAITGILETVLWENKHHNYSPIAEFTNISDVLVMYNKTLDNTSNYKNIQYNSIIPEGNVCSLYIPKKHKLVSLVNADESVIMVREDCFNALSSNEEATDNIISCYANKNTDDALQVKIIDCETKKEEIFFIRNRREATMIQAGLDDVGEKLLVTSSRDLRLGDFRNGLCFIDIFDLKNISEKPICTIECDVQPSDKQFIPVKNLLALALNNCVQLWDVKTKNMIWSLENCHSLNSIRMNFNGEQIALINDGKVEIWQQKE